MAPVAGFHLHFYQPPREDPWTGVVENEWSAWPYHDWNERITAECYRAMIAVALPPGADGGTELVEPLTESSFDVGPTLHHWFESHSPDVDRALGYQVGHLASGPGTVVIAAPLVHAILPLASDVDRERLVAWGIADYASRFGTAPLGMWLPETAVDLATLETIARQGIRYTILMPTQAVRVRELGGTWLPVTAQTLDTSRSYLIRLGGGLTITVVFGHGDLSQRVAFGDLINDGTRLADTMAGALRDRDGVVLLVADGETFGHHHRFGDLALAWALRRLRRHYGFETTVAEWLSSHEPTHEVELATVSAWSCAHGVERWRSDCGCVTGEQPGWRQGWRGPLREALDWLRENLGGAVDAELARFVRSVDGALLDYGRVLSGAVEPDEFVRAHAKQPLGDDETSTVLELCEAHRNMLYSFTSCAWFFADPAEIETSIVLRYAAVAMEVAGRTLGQDLEPEFLEHLAGVHSNRPGIDGAALWRAACGPHRVDQALIVAGFVAERLASVGAARSVRGFWRAAVEPSDDSGPLERIALTHTLTLRRRVFETRAERIGALGVRVSVGDGTDTRTFELSDFGADVAARVTTSWLVEPGSTDYEGALNLLVAEVLTRPAGRDESVALVALAGAPRYVAPVAEASIRRALLAITGQRGVQVDLDLLAPLARAVDLEEIQPRP